MPVNCEYHPTVPAVWDCEKCNISLCDDCVVTRNVSMYGVEKKYHMCPKCNQEVEWLGVSNFLEPFWNRIPRFFLYPFSPNPLILNIILSVIMMIIPMQSFVGALIRFALWGAWLKYSFAAFQNTARGDLNPPPVSVQTISDDFQDIFKQIGIYIVLALFIGLAMGALGKAAGIAAMIVGFLFLPAMIILLVSTGSFIQALNPVAFVSLPWRIGTGYLVMYFFLLILGGAPTVLFKTVLGVLPTPLIPVVVVFFQNYYTLISYNLMGYVLLQYHEEIGYDVDYEDFVKEEKAGDKKKKANSPFINEIDIHLKDGDYDQALNMIRMKMGSISEGEDLDIYDRYFQLLKIKEMNTELLEHGKKYLDLLVKADDKEKARQVYLECCRIDRHFAGSAKPFLKLAGWLKKSGHDKEALRAYHTFTKSYKTDEMLPTVYFRAAEIMNEKLDQKIKAKNLLKSVIKKYPDHDLTPFMKNYLAGIRVDMS